MSVVHGDAGYASAPALATPVLEYTSPRHTLSMACSRLWSSWSEYVGGSRCRAIRSGGHRVCVVSAGTSQGRSGPHAETAAGRRPFGVNGLGELEADSTLIAVQALTVDNFGLHVKIADHLVEYQLFVWLPVPMGNDAGATTADVHDRDRLDNRWYATTLQARSEVHGGPMFISSR